MLSSPINGETIQKDLFTFQTKRLLKLLLLLSFNSNQIIKHAFYLRIIKLLDQFKKIRAHAAFLILTACLA